MRSIRPRSSTYHASLVAPQVGRCCRAGGRAAAGAPSHEVPRDTVGLLWKAGALAPLGRHVRVPAAIQQRAELFQGGGVALLDPVENSRQADITVAAVCASTSYHAVKDGYNPVHRVADLSRGSTRRSGRPATLGFARLTQSTVVPKMPAERCMCGTSAKARDIGPATVMPSRQRLLAHQPRRLQGGEHRSPAHLLARPCTCSRPLPTSPSLRHPSQWSALPRPAASDANICCTDSPPVLPTWMNM